MCVCLLAPNFVAQLGYLMYKLLELEVQLQASNHVRGIIVKLILANGINLMQVSDLCN